MPDSSQPHIVIVNDDPSIRELLTEYFAENGLRVSTAASGAEMSSILEDAAIDLVGLELRLAGEDGRRSRAVSVANRSFRSSC